MTRKYIPLSGDHRGMHGMFLQWDWMHMEEDRPPYKQKESEVAIRKLLA